MSRSFSFTYLSIGESLSFCVFKKLSAILSVLILKEKFLLAISSSAIDPFAPLVFELYIRVVVWYEPDEL